MKLKLFIINITILLLFFVLTINIYAISKGKINIIEKLGDKIPLNLKFENSNGKEIILNELFKDKPVVLAFVYYKCPGICTPLMTEIASLINESDIEIGKDYRVALISMDEKETPKIAAKKKKAMFYLVDKQIKPEDWEFLTGDLTNITKLAKATGFNYKRVGTQFIHTTSLMILTKNGKLSRYIYPRYNKNRGFALLPFSFKLAIIDATEGKIIPSVGKLLAFCFSYDPHGKTYVFDILKVVGATTIITVGFVILILVKKKKVNDNQESV